MCIRDSLDLAVLARTYDREAHAPFLTVGLQRVVLAPLVLLARLRGRRALPDRATARRVQLDAAPSPV